MAFTPTGFEGQVGETQFSQILDAIADHGVVGTYNDTSMSAAKVIGSRAMLVQPGYVYVPGVIAHLDTAANATAAAAPSPALSGSVQRIDLLVARFDWSSTGSVSLVMKAGTQSSTPVPPSVTQTPGVLFEVPLRQGVLTAAVQGEYTTATMVDRRYWIEAGKYVLPTATQLPAGRAGAVAYRPDTHQLIVYNGTGWDTFKSESDTGWGITSIPSPGGFSGQVWGRIYNGQVELQFEWTKVSTPTGSDIEFDFTIPSAYSPGGKAVDVVLMAARTKVCRLYILPGGAAHIGPMTLSAGDTIRGHISYGD